MIYLLIVIMILFILIGFLIAKRVFNPLTIFNGIWLIVICLYQLKLSYLQDSLSDTTIKLFMNCMIFFSISFFLSYCIKYRNKGIKKEKDKIIEYKTIKKLLFFWIIVEIIETILSGGLPIIWSIIGSSKTYFDYGISSVHGLMNAIGLVIIMLCYYLYEYKKSREGIKEKKLLYIIVFMLLFYLCLITRQIIISAAIQLVIIKLYFVKKIPWKKLGILVVLGILAFGLIGNLRTGYSSFLSVAMMKGKVNSFFIGIYWVYMYLTMTVANINNVVLLDINGYGLYPILSTYLPTVISNLIFSTSNIAIPNYLVTYAFNVSGFFIDFYLGFGNLGVIIISSIYGILGGYISKKELKNKNEKNILYNAIYMQIIILSFFYNHLLYLPSGFQFIMVFLIFKFYYRGEK